VPLAEQSVVSGYAVRAKKEDGQTAGAMCVIEPLVPFKHFEESERRSSNEPIRVRSHIAGIDMRSPPVGNQVMLAEMEPGQRVVPAEAMRGVPKFRLQGGLGHAVVRIHETMRAVRRTKHFHGVPVSS